MKTVQSILFFLGLVTGGCAQQKKAIQQQNDDRPVAFTGAEGFGRYASGGRGGKVYIVTNLNDNGAGSFREAAEAMGKRIIVFAVSGTIHLEKKLSIKSDATIAGQSAPGDGICLADNSVSISGDNVIVRFLRFRMGDKYQKGGMVDGNGGDDAFGAVRRKQLIIDHCSMSWSTDEVFSVYMGDSTTLQWNLISEPLNYSYHFETGDKDYEHHGYGGIWGGAHLSAHHNLFAHCNNRTPRFNGIRNAPTEFADFCNNVIYNWGGNNAYAGEGGEYNFINNYYRWGPSTAERVKYRIWNPYRSETIPFGKFYVAGNYVDGSPEVTSDNWRGVILNNGTAQDKENTKMQQPFAAEHITVQSAEKAYDLVLKQVGAIFPVRDTLDQRIIMDVKKRTGKLIDVQGGHPHGTEYEQTITAWPTLQSKPAPVDTDRDGMPDEWERKHKLDPGNAADASAYTLSKQFTNIEVYLDELVILAFLQHNRSPADH